MTAANHIPSVRVLEQMKAIMKDNEAAESGAYKTDAEDYQKMNGMAPDLAKYCRRIRSHYHLDYNVNNRYSASCEG